MNAKAETVDPTTQLPEPEALGFGVYLGGYLVSQHNDGKGWSKAEVLKRDDARVAIASGSLQYGLSVFEGSKAYRGADGSIHLFRPADHARRLALSAQRLRMPDVSEADFIESCKLAVKQHEKMIPPHGRGSLYLRPTVHADEESLGLKRAALHRYTVTVTPSSDPPLKTLRLWAEPDFIRAAPGGLGAAKTGANYAAGLPGLLKARDLGYDDVAWLDAATHSLLGEAGTMNLFVQIGDELCTPPLDGTILAGITRDSIIRIARDSGIKVSERHVSLDELVAAQKAGTLGTAFGCGTAARIALITELGNDKVNVKFKDTGLAKILSAELKAAQEGSTTKYAEWRLAI